MEGIQVIFQPICAKRQYYLKNDTSIRLGIYMCHTITQAVNA